MGCLQVKSFSLAFFTRPLQIVLKSGQTCRTRADCFLMHSCLSTGKAIQVSSTSWEWESFCKSFGSCASLGALRSLNLGDVDPYHPDPISKLISTRSLLEQGELDRQRTHKLKGVIWSGCQEEELARQCTFQPVINNKSGPWPAQANGKDLILELHSACAVSLSELGGRRSSPNVHEDAMQRPCRKGLDPTMRDEGTRSGTLGNTRNFGL